MRLPVSVTTVTYAEYADVPVTLTEEEALARAREAIETAITEGTRGDRILARYENVSFDGGVCAAKGFLGMFKTILCDYSPKYNFHWGLCI